MVQNPKGGGLSSSMGGSQLMGGVQKTTDFLDKSTWTLATILIVLILLSSLSFTGVLSESDSKIIDTTPAAVAPKKEMPASTKPAATPAEQAPVVPATK